MCPLRLFGRDREVILMCSSKNPVQIDTAPVSIFLFESSISKRAVMTLLLPTLLAACAQLSVNPQRVQPTDPAIAAHAIDAEAVPPAKVMVRDFEVSPASVRDNTSP